MKLSELKNIGHIIEQKLIAVDIKDSDDLAALGSQEAFARLYAVYPEVCVVHLYALESALRGIPVSELPLSIRQDLQEYHRQIK